MHKINKYSLLFSLVIILFFCLSSVSAIDNGDIDSNITMDNMDVDSSLDIVNEVSSETNEDVLCYSSSSVVSSDSDTDNPSIYRVNHRNFKMYFDKGVLKPEYGGSHLVFDGEFKDMGVIKIKSDNTIITGSHSFFNNTVFNLDASGIVLSNITMIIDKSFKDNERAGIYVHGDNITIYNCIMNYTAPKIVNAFGIYCDGHKNDYVGLTIINNTINFSGIGGYKYGILLRNVHDSLVYGNHLDCELPLKFIPYYATPSYGSVSRDTVAALAADYCENLTLSNNYIHSSVNDIVDRYPTLDTVVLYGCSHSLIENNTIISEDFLTPIGTDNYLQALDLYSLDDITIIGNNISLFTNGGKPDMGTAYAIQINGPVHNAKIAFNRLTTFNRGPNCAIYSQNFYGDTYIDIISNFINVTGDVSSNYDYGNPDWSLVSGIEVQDTNDNILNNTIIVNNLGAYKPNTNVYGISYIQNTDGSHTYNIQFNNITTNWEYGVKLIGKVKNSTTKDSTIANNVINTNSTSKEADASTDNQVKAPSGSTVENNTNGIFKNKMSGEYLPDWLKNYMANGAGYNVPDLTWIERSLKNDSQNSRLGNNSGNGNSIGNSIGDSKGLFNGNNPGLISGSGNNDNSSNNKRSIIGKSNKGDVDGDRNSTMWTYGVSGSSLAASSLSSPSDVGSSASDPNAYEIEEVESVAKTVTSWNAYILVVIFMLLLIIGYKYRKEDET